MNFNLISLVQIPISTLFIIKIRILRLKKSIKILESLKYGNILVY